MEFTITIIKTGVSTVMRIPDEKCDALLDKLSARMPVNREMDLRWERMMAKREAALLPPAIKPKRRK